MISVFYHSKTDSGIGNLKKVKIMVDLWLAIIYTMYRRKGSDEHVAENWKTYRWK
nr:MAG TPA: hypothetical protein [Caudoviricetes sp.]